MSKSERRLDDLIYGDTAFDEARQTDLRRDIVEELDYKRKTIIIRVTVYVLLCIGFVVLGAWWVASAGDMRSMLLAFFIMMVGLESSVLVKLWFWVVDSRIATTKEIKQVQLQLSQMTVQLEAISATGTQAQGGSDHEHA